MLTVLANKDSEVLFDLREPLERIYDRLEAQEMPFDVERAKPILADVWTSSKSRAIDPLSVGPSNPYDRIKALVDGRASVSVRACGTTPKADKSSRHIRSHIYPSSFSSSVPI